MAYHTFPAEFSVFYSESNDTIWWFDAWKGPGWYWCEVERYGTGDTNERNYRGPFPTLGDAAVSLLNHDIAPPAEGNGG
jgi:hypothetical protein